MDRTLREIVRELKSRFKKNPPEVDLSTLLQLEIIRSGEEYSEEDIFQALRELGFPEEEFVSWLEDMASWV